MASASEFLAIASFSIKETMSFHGQLVFANPRNAGDPFDCVQYSSWPAALQYLSTVSARRSDTQMSRHWKCLLTISAKAYHHHLNKSWKSILSETMVQ